jgi:cytochrome c553
LYRKPHVWCVLGVLAWAAFVGGCSTPAPGIERGRFVYDTCVPCHGQDGIGKQEIGAPAIAGLPEWYLVRQLTKFKDGIRGAHPDDAEGARMRPMARSLYRPGDLESVAKYVSKMPMAHPVHALTGGDAEAGRTSYSTICATCHGADGTGNEAMGAPSLQHQADWYMYAQLGKFRSKMRGAHPKDQTGALMMAMSSTLPDSAAMRNVVAYIRTLQK